MIETAKDKRCDDKPCVSQKKKKDAKGFIP